MIVFDTAVLVYAVGEIHLLREPCRSAVRLVQQQRLRATTSVEAIQEFVHVRSRRRSRHDATRHGRAYVLGFSPLLQPDERDLSEALELFERIASLGAFDAVLAASARRRGWPLVSTDGAFAEVDRLTFLDPGRPAFLDDLLATDRQT